MKRLTLFFLIITISFANMIKLPNNGFVYNYKNYKIVLQREAKKQFNNLLKKQVKKFGVTVDKEDLKKIENNTKKVIDNKLTNKLRNAYRYFHSLHNFTGISINEIKAGVKQIVEKQVEQEFNKQIKDVIYQSLSQTFSIGGCCCAGVINHNVNSISQYFMPKIKKESILVGETAKLLNKIENTTYKNRLKSSNWKDGSIGDNIISTLNEFYFFIKSRDTISKNEPQEFLKLKAELNLIKSKITEGKIKLYEIKGIENGGINKR